MIQQKPIILIVDDDPDNLEYLITYLSQLNYEVSVAENGASALERIRHILPDLILMDVMMPPGIDGFETCRQLKTIPETANIPVIFMTLLDGLVNIVRGFEVGGVDYLTKPIEETELSVRIQTHLTLHRLQQGLQNEVKKHTEALQVELNKRRLYEKERDNLYRIIRQQSDQLQEITRWLIEMQQESRQGISYALHRQVGEKLLLAQANLKMVNSLMLNRASGYDPLQEKLFTHLEIIDMALTQLQEHVQTISRNLQIQAEQEGKTFANPLLTLSAREREVVTLMAQGKTNADIALLLNISINSVGTYRRRIKQKLQIEDNATLMQLVLQHGLPQ
ncbi:response regulator [Anaerolineales bacterium HSG24]|nr:response regulator [Anaerolineales bacterium HSG24]